MWNIDFLLDHLTLKINLLKIFDYRHNSDEEFLKENRKKRIMQWNEIIKKQIATEQQNLLSNFSFKFEARVDEKDKPHKYINCCYAINIRDVTIELFSNEFYFQIVKNKLLSFDYRKIKFLAV